MSLKKERFIKGVILAPDSIALDGLEGEIKVDSATGKIQTTLKDGANPSAAREILTSSQTQTLTNKTLDVDNNTVSNIETDNLKAGVLNTNTSLTGASDTQVPSALAAKTYIDTANTAQQNIIDDLVTLSGVASGAENLGTFTGITIPDNSTNKQALQALETELETKAESSDLTTHTGASSDVHGVGVGNSVVGTGTSQALTNKTIDADLNTISNIEDADIKVGAAISRAKLASGTANRVVVNNGTGVQTDAAAITAARALISDANGIPTHSSVTSTELGYSSGVTSGIQTQLDAKVDEVGGTFTSGSVITPIRSDVKQDTKANLTTYALTASNGQLVFATDTKEMFQVVDTLLVAVGGGEGVGGVDILFTQTFETAAITDFTQTGLSLSTSNPLHGEISALLTHQPAVNQSFKQIIPVDRKFRGETMTLRLNCKSNAPAGDVTINIYDETNAANLVASEQLQLSNDASGAISRVGFTIPETCASISYTITALPEAGSPVTRIDDIIAELAVTSLLETAVEVPVVTAWQGYTPTFQGFGTPTNVEFEWRQVGENAEIRGKFVSGSTTAVEARVGLPAGLTSAGTSLIPSIQVVGKGSKTVTATTFFGGTSILIEPSVSYMTLGFEGSTFDGVTKVSSTSTFVGLGNTFSFSAKVPCAGLSATSTKTIALTQSGLVQHADSNFEIGTPVGASTNTLIRTFSGIFSNSGDAVLYTKNATLGDSITILKDGVYNINYSEGFTTAGIGFAITKNYAINTAANSIPRANVLAFAFSEDAVSWVNQISFSGKLVTGDVIRFATGTNSTIGNAYQGVSISYQGSLKQVSVSSDQKITIPTSELRFEGIAGRGITDTTIVQFLTQTKIRGDAFTIESDSTFGTRITIKKAGRLSAYASVYSSSAGNSTYISKNQTTRTTNPSASEIIASAYMVQNEIINLSSTVDVNVGDVIRVCSLFAPTAESRNIFHLSFQEQEIAVSVTNTLPQFSDSDSSVRVDTANGYGSTATKIRRFSNVRDNIGVDIEYVDSATNGSSFTVRESGVYNISYTDQFSAINNLGISKNASTLTTNITAISTGERLILGTTGGIDYNETVSWQGYLVAGDIIRAHTNGVTTGVSPAYVQFTMSKVGKPNVTGVNVTPFVNVPQPVSGTYAASLTSTMTIASLIKSSGSGLFTVSTVGGRLRFTALKRISINAYGDYNPNVTNGGGQAEWYINGTLAARENSIATGVNALNGTSVTINTELFAGEFVEFLGQIIASATFNTSFVSLTAEALSDQILTAPETFSTDTAALSYASSAAYTLSTLQNAPVGTYITFTYAINTNTRTQTSTRPTQTDADMNANGMLIYTRAYNAASTAAQPAAFAVQIGKGLKGKSIDLYKSSGKVTSGSLDSILYSVNATQEGTAFKEYNELTGILLIDAGYTIGTSVTNHAFAFSDITFQTSGYLVISASKNPALTGIGLNRIAARGVNTAGTSIPTNTTTIVTYDATKTFDTHGALNAATGIFTAPESGYYQVNGRVHFQATGAYAIGNQIITFLFKNGVQISELDQRQVESAAVHDKSNSGADVIYLAKNDTLDMRTFNNRTAGATLLSTSAGHVYFSISKVSV